MSEVASPKTYQDTGWTLDVSNGYNPSKRTYLDDNELALKYYPHLSNASISASNYLSDEKIAELRAYENDMWSDYMNVYNTIYNNESNTTQRQVDAGYNPYYLNASGASQHSAASGGIGSMQDPYKMLELKNQKKNQLFNMITGGLSALSGGFINFFKGVADVKKTQAETDLLNRTNPEKVRNATNQADLNRQKTLTQWLFNNSEYTRQFGKSDNGIFGIIPDSDNGFLGISEGSTADYFNKGIKTRTQLEGLNYEKLFSLLKGGLVENLLKAQSLANEIEQYNADYANKLKEKLDTDIIPAVLSGHKYSKNIADFYGDSKIVKSDYVVNKTKDLIGVITDVIGAVAKIKGVNIASSQDALKWLLETGEAKP